MKLLQHNVQRITRKADAQPLAENARGGFTFVELLMVLCVLVVLTSMALPAVLRWQRGMPLEQAISILQMQLQETRLAAIRSGESWIIVLPQDQTPGRRGPASNSTGDDRRFQFVLPARIQCRDQSTGENAGPIFCHPDGTVSDRQLELQDSDGRLTILKIDRLTGTASVIPRRTAASDTHAWQACHQAGLNLNGAPSC